MGKPILLSDSQLDAVMTAAKPLEPADRALFLQDVADRLAGRELGDGVVARTASRVQRRYFSPPDLSGSNGRSRWR